MNISKFFIDRPIFAGVIALFITLIGAFAYPQLPLSQYPEIAPPTVTVSAFYPGASAETLAQTVAAPLEQEINGVEGMLYLSSSSTSDGAVVVTVTFRPGTDLDQAQVLTQNRVSLAEPRLPEEVRQVGVTVNKAATDFLMIVALTSNNSAIDVDYMGNYANSVLRDKLLRLDGVGAVTVFGGGNYSMRVWIDPAKAAALNLTSDDIVGALRSQNIQAAGGGLGSPPFPTNAAAFQLPIQVEGRLVSPEQFSNVVIKTDASGRVTRIRDVARVEIGSQDYGVRGYFGGKRGIALAIVQQPGSNALATAERVEKALEEARKTMPAGVEAWVPYNPTEYVAASVHEVQKTLFEAMLLVVVVVIVFLQTWRAAIIPILAIPIALIGSMAILLALGFSLNSLSLFGLVLAVGIVVDDAIVVVESVERHIREGLAPRQAAYRTMQEVSGALIAIGLVLVAVFVPTAFVPGIPGEFYRQFAVTISAASVISLIVSLTLSPAMAALLLKPHALHHEPTGPFRYLRKAGDTFNGAFDWLSDRYGRLTAKLVRMTAMVLVVYAGLLALTAWRLVDTPSGFIPEQDQGFLIGVVQLPPGASLERTDKVMARALEIANKNPAVVTSAAFAGMDGSSFSAASNSATIFFKLADMEDRKGKENTAVALAGQFSQALGSIEDATIFIVAPPAVQGMGNGNGFKMMIQDRGGAGYKALEGATYAMMGAAAQDKKVNQVFSLYNTATPRITADVDRDKAQLLGVQPSQVYSTMGTYLGSTYVNDFNMLGRTFRVTAQAEPSARDDLADVANLKVRSNDGSMVPIGSLADLKLDSGPARVVRYNLMPASELQGAAGAGVSTGQALAEMESLAAKNLPPGFTYEWTELAYQQKAAAGAGSVIVFVLAVVFVFLVLAAQYEALTLPLAVILIRPIGLRAPPAKNAILIVEFAKQGEEQNGLSRFDAAVSAARTRLRPILMTSFAFILGVLPLAIATGPGAEMRQALGTAVFFGMIGVTLFGLIFTPVFYVVCRWLGLRIPRAPKKGSEMPTTFSPGEAASETL